MARKGGSKLSDPIDGTRQVNTLDSGLVHCADSLGPGREGTFVQRFGSPGDPLEKSAGVKGGFMGKVPNLNDKFIRKGQR